MTLDDILNQSEKYGTHDREGYGPLEPVQTFALFFWNALSEKAKKDTSLDDVLDAARDVVVHLRDEYGILFVNDNACLIMDESQKYRIFEPQQ